MNHRAPSFILALVLFASSCVGCLSNATFTVNVPETGLDAIVVVLAELSPDGFPEVLAYSDLLPTDAVSASLRAGVREDAALRLGVFGFDASTLTLATGVPESALFDNLAVVAAPGGTLPLPARDPGGEHLSAPFAPGDTGILLEAVTPGSASALVLEGMAMQLQLLVMPLVDGGPVVDAGSGDAAGMDAGDANAPSDAGEAGPADAGGDSGAPDADAAMPADSGMSSDGAVVLGPWAPPAIIPNLADPAGDDDPTLTADLLEIYFDSARAGGPGGGDIWSSTRVSAVAPWSVPVPLAGINSASNESTPEISRDGLTLWFSSDRSGGAGGFDIWVATRTGRGLGWSAPVAVTELNTTGNDFPVTLTQDGLLAYFSSERPAGLGLLDIWAATRPATTNPWDFPQTLVAELSGSASDSNPWIGPLGLNIWFDSTASGDRDIFTASRLDPLDPFGSPVPEADLNTSFTDSDPWVSDDFRYMVFSSNRSGNFELYESSR